MKVLLGTITCFTMLLNAPSAEAAFKGCYERLYDKAYLKKHRKQDVMKIRLQLGVGKGLDGPFELLDRVDAGFRSTTVYRGNLVECKPDGEGLRCGIASDGGIFTVTDRGNSSLRITNRSYMRFGDGDTSTTITATGEHREFRLYRISKKACP